MTIGPETDDVDPVYDALMRARPGEYGAGPEELVASLLRRPAWHQRAACRGVGPDAFYLAAGGRPEPARALCARCPVTADCLDAADGHGMWAGTSPKQRQVQSTAA